MHNFDQKSLSLCGGCGDGGGTIERVTKGNKRRETVNRYFERTSFDEIGGEEIQPGQNFTKKLHFMIVECSSVGHSEHRAGS